MKAQHQDPTRIILGIDAHQHDTQAVGQLDQLLTPLLPLVTVGLTPFWIIGIHLDELTAGVPKQHMAHGWHLFIGWIVQGNKHHRMALAQLAQCALQAG